MLYFKLLFLLLFAFINSCADEDEQVKDPAFITHVPPMLVPAVPLMSAEEYEKQCIRHEWYYCDLNAQWRMEVVKDICTDPHTIISVGECEEFLECDPNNYFLETIPCVTNDGLPGTLDKVCDKGKIKYTDCVTLCEEETCNGEDDDCDGAIDEHQLNACGECGFLPTEVCDGIDNNCNGVTDEDLIQDCTTACGVGIEYCVEGNWVSCTAPPVQIEICDGFDNDCDGSIDEELTCECTIDHVGALFPCNEAPLLCGQGYKTCECLDPNCATIVTTDCVAPCVYFPDPDEVCDPQIGMSLEKEECNNFDDNCNQLIDEDLYSQCYTADPSTLYIGICEPGIMTCLEGLWGNYKEDDPNFITGFCKDEIVPQEEICNGIDDDCDGIVDSGEDMNPTDILFIVDWSGSMDTEIYAVMAALNKFAGQYSDEQVLQWGTIIAPLRVSPDWGYYEYARLYHNLSGFTDFLAAMAQLNTSSYAMNGAKEMLYDLVYLSVQNLAGGALPIPINNLSWDYSKGINQSVPELKQFKINWRPNSKRVIIIFTDERGQTYTDPQITQDVLLPALSASPELKVYTFSTPWYKENGSVHAWGWEPLSTATGGTWYELTSDMLTMYNNLMEIIDENACE